MPENESIEKRDLGIDLSVLGDGLGIRNNIAFVVGTLKGNFDHNYTSSLTKESYYRAILSVSRKSGINDNIRIMVPEKLIYNQLDKFVRGVSVKVSGMFCSHLHTETGGKQRLRLYLLAESIELYPYEIPPEHNNVVYLAGEINKTPFKRKRQSSHKVITDIFVAAKRENHTKYDYIPCIAWGRAAYIAEELKVEDRIALVGRIQSRMYNEWDEGTKREVYEISIFGILDISKKEEKEGKE